MRPQTIKAKLVERGISQKQIARKAGVSKQAVNNAIHGRTTSAKIERTISRVIGIPRKHAFPRATAPSSRRAA